MARCHQSASHLLLLSVMREELKTNERFNEESLPRFTRRQARTGPRSRGAEGISAGFWKSVIIAAVSS